MRPIPGIQKKSFSNSKSHSSLYQNRGLGSGFSRNGRSGRTSKSGFGKLFNKKSWSSSLLLKLLLFCIGIPVVAGVIWFYAVILNDLPNIRDLSAINSFSEASTIADRNGKSLYKIFEENRQYVTIDQISPTLQDAIVATEDQSFWDNAGVDFYGFAKAGVLCIIKGTNHADCRGASTITQQLIKNIYLTNERSIVRKLKEIVLALRLKNVLEAEVQQTNPGLSSTELQQKVKEKVLELYLNYIFLGNNSYGVEAASTNYFATGALHLDILESSILAGIPQAPSRYNVYTNRDTVMGYLSIVDKDSDEEIELDETARSEVYLKAASILTEGKINGSSANSIINYLRDLQFDYSYGSGSYQVQYKLGRKDEVLARMYDTQVITDKELIDAVIKGFSYEFKKAKIGLTAPHFVFWIRELLESPNNKYMGTFDPEILYKGGLTITTTLDLDIQQMAEKAVKDNMASVNGYGAGNASLIHLDSTRGDILAYVGSADFNNLDIKGQNDMVRAPIQPGSSIKPLWYALGFMKLPLTLDTDMYDIQFKVGDYDPQNSDGTFMGAMPLRKALAFSRNIPAVKMYFAVGQQAEFIKFAKSMGVESLKDENNYGPSMAIGSAEMQMLELANMYAHLSAQGKPAVIDPIMEIKAKDGTIIYKRTVEQQTQVIPSGVAYLLWKTLSEAANMPTDWARRFAFPGVTFAHKTGTSNIRTKDGKRMPKDGWLATYTPSKVTLLWAGNTTPKALNANAFGGWINHSTWKQFRTDLQKGGYLTNETVAETEVKRVTIARNSGKLATENTPEGQKISTLAYVGTAPTEYDSGIKEIQVDSLCYGKVSDLTPPEDIIPGYISKIVSFMPNNMDLNDIMTYVGGGQKLFGEDGAQSYTLFASEPEQVCPERQAISTGSNNTGSNNATGGRDTGIGLQLSVVKPANNASVSNNFALRYTAKSNTPVATVDILVNGKAVGSYQYTTNSVNDTKTINIADAAAGTTHAVTIKATDAVGTTTEQTINIKIQGTDNRPPYILRPNTQVIPQGGSYAVTLVFSDLDSSVKGGAIIQGGKQIATFEGSVASFTTSTLGTVSFTVSDFYNNLGEGSVDLNQYVQ